MPKDLDCRDLAEVHRRVVEPVVRALLRPDELEAVIVRIDPPPPTTVRPRATDNDAPTVRASVTACGETLDIFLGSVSDQPWDAGEAANWFYDALTNELPETGFAWGELREDSYAVPEPADR